MDKIVMTCSCGIPYTLAAFRELESCGEQSFNEPPFRLEMRNCVCGSTRGIWTDLDGEPCEGDRNE